MPLLNQPNMQSRHIGGTAYDFSAVRVDHLGASEYTLVVIASDCSSSTSGFQRAHTECLKSIVRACRRSPRADNLMLRLVTFDDKLREIHGFKPLMDCDPDDYDKAIRARGMTALFDATYNCVQSAIQYGRDLIAQDFQANAIVFVITDGQDNRSAMTPGAIQSALGGAVRDETLESVQSVLIGLETAGRDDLKQYLRDFEHDAGFSRYIDVGAADEDSLARLADFVSRSISAQSRALGSGGGARPLTF